MKVFKDIEYVYKKGIELKLPIALQRSTDLGFIAGADYFVITGESEFGKMILYQEDENDIEFVFTIEYNKRKLFSKKTVKRYTHWHPSDYQAALDDMIAFMNTDEKYFKIDKYLK